MKYELGERVRMMRPLLPSLPLLVDPERDLFGSNRYYLQKTRARSTKPMFGAALICLRRSAQGRMRMKYDLGKPVKVQWPGLPALARTSDPERDLVGSEYIGSNAYHWARIHARSFRPLFGARLTPGFHAMQRKDSHEV